MNNNFFYLKTFVFVMSSLFLFKSVKCAEECKKLYMITGNKNKFAEIKQYLPNVEQLDIDLVEIQEVDARKVVEAKLKEALKHSSGEFVLEDTSLDISSLNGLPGPF